MTAIVRRPPHNVRRADRQTVNGRRSMTPPSAWSPVQFPGAAAHVAAMLVALLLIARLMSWASRRRAGDDRFDVGFRSSQPDARRIAVATSRSHRQGGGLRPGDCAHRLPARGLRHQRRRDLSVGLVDDERRRHQHRQRSSSSTACSPSSRADHVLQRSRRRSACDQRQPSAHGYGQRVLRGRVVRRYSAARSWFILGGSGCGKSS